MAYNVVPATSFREEAQLRRWSFLHFEAFPMLAVLFGLASRV